jgi:hypothetical protein
MNSEEKKKDELSLKHESLRMEMIEMLVKNYVNDQDLGREVRRFVTIKERINKQEDGQGS